MPAPATQEHPASESGPRNRTCAKVWLRARRMKETILLALADEDLIELERVIIDEDAQGALDFLKRHVERRARATLGGEGHCKPYFEMPGRSAVPEHFLRRTGSRDGGG